MPDLGTSITVVDACGRGRVPPLLKSHPGMGKSKVVTSFAAHHQLPCEIILGNIRDQADIGGYPLVRQEREDYVLVPGAWARHLAEEGRGVAFFDELTTCPPAVQSAMLTVILDRTVGDLQLPPEVMMVAGANPTGSAAGGYELEPPMANRFCHVDFAPTTEEWLDGMATDWNAPPPSRAVSATDVARAAAKADVLGFVRANPTLLNGFEQAKDKSGPWPSARTWDMLARTLPHLKSDDTPAVHTLVCGLVGTGVGEQFLTWRNARDLPDPASVVADPSCFDWATARDDRVATVLLGVVAWEASRGTVEAWREAWGPLLAARQAGRTTAAAAAARALGKARPPSANIPAQAKKAFQPVLAKVFADQSKDVA
ncbi:AAA family ATPase [Nocardia sp. IFM 10818]